MLNRYLEYWERTFNMGAVRSWSWLGVGGKLLNVVIALVVGFFLGQKDILRTAFITAGVLVVLYLLILVIFAIFIVPYQDHGKLARTVSRLRSKKKEPAALLELTKLRKVGIELRNHGARLADPAEFDQWNNEFETWNDQVIKLVKKVSKVRAGIIETLGNLPRGGYPSAISDLHRLKLNVFDEKLRRLQVFLEEFSP